MLWVIVAVLIALFLLGLLGKKNPASKSIRMPFFVSMSVRSSLIYFVTADKYKTIEEVQGIYRTEFFLYFRAYLILIFPKSK